MSKKITDKYKKLTDIEHVLARPAIYIGSVQPKEHKTGLQLFYDDGDSRDNIENRYDLQIVPGLITLCNELLTNSLDEFQRCRNENRKHRLDTIDFTVNQKEGTLEIYDNGGIPVVQHDGYENEWLPSILFGSLRSGSNYTDERGSVAGVNGVGASLVNVLSTRFELWTADGTNEYHCVWTNNMREKHIEATKKSKKRGTYIKAKIDFSIFPDTENIDDLHASIFEMRSAEIAAAGCDTKKPIKVNFKLIDFHGREFTRSSQFKHFWDFSNMFPNSKEFWGEDHDRMKLEIGPSNSPGIESVAIVNGIRTDFGTHINFVALTIADYIREHLRERHKIDLKPAQIYNRFRIYSYWRIDAPSFNNQMKEELTTNTKDFGFDIEISDKFKRSLLKSKIVEQIIQDHKIREKMKEQDELKAKQKNVKKGNSHKHIFVDSLVDATKRGNRDSCTLYLVEGDSAAGAARECRKSEEHGIFTLMGKSMKNSIYQSAATMLSNKNVAGLIQAIGLKFNEPVDESLLRYGKLAMLTDADYDGYHIYCNMLAFFYKFWPELFDKGYMYTVESPIMTAKKHGEVIFFYTREEYEKQKEQLIKDKWDLDYIKGLGSLEPEDYALVIREPRLRRVRGSELTWPAMHGWFGVESEARKQLIAGADIEDIAHMFN